jgi:hypothetical protein
MARRTCRILTPQSSMPVRKRSTRRGRSAKGGAGSGTCSRCLPRVSGTIWRGIGGWRGRGRLVGSCACPVHLRRRPCDMTGSNGALGRQTQAACTGSCPQDGGRGGRNPPTSQQNPTPPGRTFADHPTLVDHRARLGILHDRDLPEGMLGEILLTLEDLRRRWLDAVI